MIASAYSYNTQPHRREPHSRIEDWVRNLPCEGLRQMCSWQRFCAFAREPERRTVAGDARIRVDGAFYDVDSDLAGETVTLWWGLFDQELFVEFKDRRFGPYCRTHTPAWTTSSLGHVCNRPLPRHAAGALFSLQQKCHRTTCPRSDCRCRQ